MLPPDGFAGAQRCCPGPLRQPNQGQSFQPHPSTFAFSGFEGAQTAAALQTTWPPVGPESCWGSAVSHACPRRGPLRAFSGVGPSNHMLPPDGFAGAQRCCPGPLRQPNQGQSFQPHPSTFAFSGFEGAQTAAALQTTWPPVGPESCWGSAVSHACPRRGPLRAFSGVGPSNHMLPLDRLAACPTVLPRAVTST